MSAYIQAPWWVESVPFKMDLVEASPIEHRRGEFVISTDRGLLDLDRIHAFLTNSYWAKGIAREAVARSLESSLCFCIYDEGGEKSPVQQKAGFAGAPGQGARAQIGFARVVSDFATVAYLGDVFVLEAYRGRGLGKWLMECIMQHPALQGLRRWILLTRDAHGLYARFGFTPLESPGRFMELHNRGVYPDRSLDKTTG